MQNRRFSKKPASFTPSDLSLTEATDPGQSDPSQDRCIRGIINRKVGQLIGRAGFTQQDRESLEHDLLARVFDSLSKFDPEVGHRNTFVTAVVERYVANILRDKTADKRDHCRIRSLNVTIDVVAVPVSAPFPQVAMHVVEPPGVRLLSADRMRRVAVGNQVVDVLFQLPLGLDEQFARVDRLRSCVVPIPTGLIETVLAVAQAVCTCGSSAADVFPFGLGG